MASPRLSQSLTETLERFGDSSEPRTTAEVAERLDVGRRSTYDRLERLVDLGELETKKVGASARIWWRPQLTPASRDDTAAEDGAEETASSGTTDAGDDGGSDASESGQTAGSADGAGSVPSYADTIPEAIDDGVFVLDEALRVEWVNDAFADMLRYDRTELQGADCSEIFDDATDRGAVADVCERARELAESGVDGSDGERHGSSVRFDAAVRRGDGSRFSAEITFTVVQSGRTGRRTVGTLRDVTDLIARERELEQYETIVETIDDGVYVVDETGCFVMVNEAYADMVGYEAEELIGMSGSTVVDEETAERAAELHRDLASGDAETARLEAELATGDEPIVAEATFALIESVEDPQPRVGVVRDVTERTERERELENRIRQQEVVANLGQRALEDRDVDPLMAEAAELVADTLDVAYCKVLDLDAAGEELLLRQGVGWDDGLVGSATVSAVDDGSQAAYTLAHDSPVVVDDLSTESRFNGPDLLTDHDVRSGISTIIGPADDPWGVLGTHDTTAREFTEQDVNFVQSVANVIATAVARNEHERTLVRHRQQLEALNSLNAVVHEITDAVIDQSTREEIETTVCDRLANTDSYQLAWIGDVDVASQEVSVRARAGVEGFLDDVAFPVDHDEQGGGPTGRALRTGEIRTTQDADDDTWPESWRESVEAYGFESAVAVPITHDETLYGVLNIYADRQHAFEGQELDVIAQLGEVVAHAIAAADRMRALMGDEVVEVEFQILDLFEGLSGAVGTEGTIRLDHTIPVGDDEFIVYGTATPDAVTTVETLVETVPHWIDVTFREGSDRTRFELLLDEPPVLSAVASLGGSVERAVIDDGDFRMTIHLSPSVDVRNLIDAVTDAYPRAEMVKRRQVERGDRVDRVRHVLDEEVTDRQRTALEAAFHAGFFEWPRETSGEEVATALGISPSTFHQHLRAAEQKIFASLLSPGASLPEP